MDEQAIQIDNPGIYLVRLKAFYSFYGLNLKDQDKIKDQMTLSIRKQGPTENFSSIKEFSFNSRFNDRLWTWYTVKLEFETNESIFVLFKIK